MLEWASVLAMVHPCDTWLLEHSLFHSYKQRGQLLAQASVLVVVQPRDTSTSEVVWAWMHACILQAFVQSPVVCLLWHNCCILQALAQSLVQVLVVQGCKQD